MNQTKTSRAAGTLRLYTQTRQWLLTPQRGAWLSAGTAHRVTTRSASLRTVYLAKDLVKIDTPCLLFEIPPLGREMVVYATRWPETSSPTELSEMYFRTLAGLCVTDWMLRTFEFSLPTGRTEETRRAITYTLEDLAMADIDGAARAAHVSARTLSRRFNQELGLSWRDFLRQARLLRAIELLDQGHSVTTTSLHVGYDSLSAFSRAFKDYVGQTPQSFSR